MVPTIGRWDTTMIHQAIKDIKVEDFEIASAILPIEKREDYSKNGETKTTTKKRKKTSAKKHDQGEDFEIADLTGEKVKDSSKKTKKRLTRKRKSIVATKDVMEPDQISKTDEAHQCSTIDEAQQ
ncbi:hypothetical protein DVH24_007957 [Malus domestica]|uniref:Uncharacterized protein n=1 Tax=Malus domestica TaxID=3750 RepID=A0A498JKS9_MALDO|nr:hypothetical protein DVH24_007957 [Malus domestica]